MRSTTWLVVLSLVPTLVAGQQDPTGLLREMPPGDVRDQVIRIVEQAMAGGLPGRAAASRALYGFARGRSGPEVLTATREFVEQLGDALQAIRAGGRHPSAPEVEAAATAMSLGVGSPTIGALASSAPLERSLVVPLAVVGALTGAGVPAEEALAVVRDRLEARALDADLVGVPAELGRLLREGFRPEDAGAVLLGGGAPAPPIPGIILPAGPPTGIPGNGGDPGVRPRPPVSPPVKPPIPIPASGATGSSSN
jgi:hypothetical protein